MNLLSVIHYPFFGGPHNQALRLTGPLAARSIETTVVLPAEPGNAAQRLRDGGVPVLELPLGRLRARPNPVVQAQFLAGFAEDIARLRRLIRDRRIDVVQLNGLVNPHAAVAARLEGAAVVWQLLDTRAPVALRRALMPVVTRLSDVVMSTGMAVAAAHPGAEDLGERLVPFFPPVDLDEFRPDPMRRSHARKLLRIDDGAPLIGTVANLTPQKGLEHFVDAAVAIKQARPRARFVLLGRPMETQGGYERMIRARAEAAGLLRCGSLMILDPGANVARLLPALDAFILSSVPRSEGIPTTVLEAMASGVPVVATDVGGVREAVRDASTGRVVEPCRPEQLARAVLDILACPQELARAAAESRRVAVEEFGVDRCADAHECAYLRALALRPVKGGPAWALISA